ncbi:hypothetical protein CIG11343_1011 [Campylobacter iguaniorum]|uniref:hypothetical protein n=1 Tax=Campylobacter iguaniorum TaxID=1244531 RepID=UPI00073A2F82|nr:hypothetical protein [Campylobacter iguaniorum]ALV24670.1 hypothetical protein CIG2463D_1098 [Campylobacter iguaniorum]ANE36026.1 hypothetical protein CIG11343_1011 [Campylobacter iguaniorum]
MKIFFAFLLAIFCVGCAKNTNIQKNEAPQVPFQDENQTYNIEISYMNPNEQNEKDILLAYGSYLDDAKVELQEDIAVNLIGKKELQKAKFDAMARQIAGYLRDFRGIKNQVLIAYKLDEKTLFKGKF